jgi:hypothetical protein
MERKEIDKNIRQKEDNVYMAIIREIIILFEKYTRIYGIV